MKMLDPAVRDRAWVDVDLAALVANARTLQTRTRTRLLPMVKANGYGLGAVSVARALATVSPWGFGVATPDEGAELRAGGIGGPIVVFSPLQASWFESMLAHGLTPAIGDVAMLAAWIGTDRPFHLEIDTGMGRAGIRWKDEAQLSEAAALLARAAHWEGVFTHFHSAETDPLATHEQWTRFQATLQRFPPRPRFVHAANSAAALRSDEFVGDLVRPGVFLYGGSAGGIDPLPVIRVSATVLAVRVVEAGETVSYGATWRASQRTAVATLGIGYADGLPRALSSRGFTEIGGVRCPIIGRVTMDMTMVDVGDHEVSPGDVATVIGGRVPLDEQARAAETISYELLTGLARRLPRVYEGLP